MRNFNAEAVGMGFPVTNNRGNAGYIFKFDVLPAATRPNVTQDDNQFVIKITFINNTDNLEILSFDFFFNNLDEMYEYNQFLFFRATRYIPPATERIVVVQEVAPQEEEEEPEAPRFTGNDWRNKWIYLRTSIDYPVTFYALQPNGLIGGIGVYDGSFEQPDRTSPEDNKILAMPGVTLGLEFHVFKHFTVETNLQLCMGDTRRNNFINNAAGLELKYPFKLIDNFMIEPYGTFVYPVTVSEVFAEFPPFLLGGGIQIGAKGGEYGAFIVDIKYLHSLEDAVMTNPYGELYPNPSGIHYKRSMIKFGIGYKLGFGTRNHNDLPRVKSEPEPRPERQNPIHVFFW